MYNEINEHIITYYHSIPTSFLCFVCFFGEVVCTQQGIEVRAGRPGSWAQWSHTWPTPTCFSRLKRIRPRAQVSLGLNAEKPDLQRKREGITWSQSRYEAGNKIRVMLKSFSSGQNWEEATQRGLRHASLYQLLSLPPVRGPFIHFLSSLSNSLITCHGSGARMVDVGFGYRRLKVTENTLD